MLDRSLNFQNKFHFTSLGCARNLVDSEVMIGILLKAGYELVGAVTDADFLVVNTCGFLEASRQEGMEVIGELFKQKKGDAKVIITGCMVQKHGKELRERFPKIHYFLGSGAVDKILEAVSSTNRGETMGSAKSFLEWGEVPRTLSTPKHYAYLKIAEGCRKRCAFCIIPTIKGPLKSKSASQVLKEFRALLSQGVFEVILIAQDLGDFGKDRRERGALVALLQEILQIEHPFWLRLLYLYPDEIDDALIALLKSDPRICPYLDMPIQHISNPILKAMHRTTSKEEILALLQKLKREIPSLSIRTSLMVGFPGEEEEHFEELLAFAQTADLEHVGLFQFSLEKEAYAARLPQQVSEEVKQQRYERLAALLEKRRQERNRAKVGSLASQPLSRDSIPTLRFSCALVPVANALTSMGKSSSMTPLQSQLLENSTKWKLRELPIAISLEEPFAPSKKRRYTQTT